MLNNGINNTKEKKTWNDPELLIIARGGVRGGANLTFHEKTGHYTPYNGNGAYFVKASQTSRNIVTFNKHRPTLIYS